MWRWLHDELQANGVGIGSPPVGGGEQQAAVFAGEVEGGQRLGSMPMTMAMECTILLLPVKAARFAEKAGFEWKMERMDGGLPACPVAKL